MVREVEEKMGNVFGKKEKTEIQTSERTRAYLKIEDGCEAFCSYCIVPRARGKVRSKPWEEIKKRTGRTYRLRLQRNSAYGNSSRGIW